jgi:hypothetical protein
MRQASAFSTMSVVALPRFARLHNFKSPPVDACDITDGLLADG